MVGANLREDMLKRSRSCEPNGLFQVGFNAMRALKRCDVSASAESGALCPELRWYREADMFRPRSKIHLFSRAVFVAL